MQRGQVAAAVLGMLCALGLSIALGRGLAPLSKTPALLGAGTCTFALFQAAFECTLVLHVNFAGYRISSMHRDSS